jgi:hypothetical protein
MTRRFVRTLVIVTVLGFVTNVVVTAWCVWWVSVPALSVGRPGYWSKGERRFIVRLDRTPGKTLFRWEPEPPGGFGLVTGMDIPPPPPSWADLSPDLRTPENMRGQMHFDRSSPVR